MWLIAYIIIAIVMIPWWYVIWKNNDGGSNMPWGGLIFLCLAWPFAAIFFIIVPALEKPVFRREHDRD